jgi:sulfide:quinone oxidoreductase
MRPRVLVVGGGVAGLEALLALGDLSEGRAELTLAASDPDFTYKPLTVEEPFLLGVAARMELGPIAAELGARLVQQAVVAVRPDDHAVELADGSSLGYDLLVVCAGGKLRAPYERSFTFPPVGPVASGITDWLDAVPRKGGKLGFVVPPGVSWPLPLYELALMTSRQAGSGGREGLRCSVFTPEQAPLVMFGAVASEAVAQLLEARGIDVHAGVHAHETDAALVLTPGDRPLEVDAVIALPLVEGPAIPGLPSDAKGFIPIDEHARVPGLEDVYAAGDGTTFPIKQGGIATQQADAAAEHIAARLGAAVAPNPFRPVLRGQLLTGEDSLNLRHEIAGGGGEGTASPDALWWPPNKISGRYLAPWVARETVHADSAPPRRSIDIEVALPAEWHEQPMALDPCGPLGVD